ncbi:hypothetical protein K438DRAFT_1847253 [Mycena galopus ATCC 62051]|nr:hypothetical protein K438DRAFT_1847253 [Mycena galopus ATCC 62051]
MSIDITPHPNAPTAPTKDALAPFSGIIEPDSDSRPPDFILRSIDGLDFHVRKDILKAVSEFFDDMFSLVSSAGGPEDLSRDGKTVLLVPESAKVLYVLLWVAYPRQSQAREPDAALDLKTMLQVHTAAKKYQFLAAQRVAKEMLEGPVLLDGHNPHRLFAIARLLELSGLARRAALRTLESPVSPASLSFPEMDLLPWSTGQKLYDFHRKCSEKVPFLVRALATSAEMRIVTNDQTGKLFIWWETERRWSHRIHGIQCGPLSVVTNKKVTNPAPWFLDHIGRLANQLRVSTPAASTLGVQVIKIDQPECTKMNACEACRKHGEEDLANFARGVVKQVDDLNAKLAEKYL